MRKSFCEDSLSKKAVQQLGLQFDDNALVPLLFGECGIHLSRIEEQIGVQIYSKGNEIVMTGQHAQLKRARHVLESLWERLSHNLDVGLDEVDAAIRIADNSLDPGTKSMARAAFQEPQVKLRHGRERQQLTARTPRQATYMEAMEKKRMVFGVGPAGTGKTYLAIAFAVMKLQKGEIERIILCRPAVEAGENLGFLPGDMKEKIDPYLRPLYDALHDMMTPEQIVRHLANGDIEVAPLAFMRGRTLTKACIVLDEAQNTTPAQMKMVLTRLGGDSHMLVTGDPSQSDLPGRMTSGLNEAITVLKDLDDIAFVQFTEEDVVRDPLVAKIVKAYERFDKSRNGQGKVNGGGQE